MKKQALFEEIATNIAQRVYDGTYVTSQKLPSEYNLAEEFQCSRLTVRKAIALLISQNLLVKEKGKGTYVMKQPKIQSGSGGLQSFTETAQVQGKKTRTEVLHVETVKDLPLKVRQMFGNYATEPIVFLVRLRYFDEEPMTVENLYVLKRYLTKTNEQLPVNHLASSLYQVIETNIEVGYAHQEVEAVKSPPDIAKLLHVAEDEPMLLVHSMTYSPSAKPILYDTSFYRADKYTFKNTLVRQK
ncbi:GntR family transcriptional regulator, LSA1692 subfamily [Enterococcus sp. DIV0876]|uniref:GntR family transcriptional regulator, LSA1692 subfamily n=1 Tax=Enterococcus sp. DIV0876 TaxID=2774633 RepID=UPI003D3010EB